MTFNLQTGREAPVLDSLSATRDQIKANAALLFPHGPSLPAGPQVGYDIVITTYTADDQAPLTSAEKTKYQAVLVYASGTFSARKSAIAAKGAPSESVAGALDGLLLVTATALESFRGDLFQAAAAPMGVEGGMVDQGLILGKSGRKR